MLLLALLRLCNRLVNPRTNLPSQWGLSANLTLHQSLNRLRRYVYRSCGMRTCRYSLWSSRWNNSRPYFIPNISLWGPVVSIAAMVEVVGSGCGPLENMSSSQIGGCGAHQISTGFSLALIRLESWVFYTSIIISRLGKISATASIHNWWIKQGNKINVDLFRACSCISSTILKAKYMS